MILAGQGYTLSCLPPFSFNPWTLYSGIGLISLCLFLTIHYIRRRSQQVRPEVPDRRQTNMEKAIITSTASPSACDILKPLSRNGTLPSSGAVAAMAREQMQNASGSPGTSRVEIPTGATENEAGGSVQRRSESMQQMHEVDTDGVRTWRRLIVEYS